MSLKTEVFFSVNMLGGLTGEREEAEEIFQTYLSSETMVDLTTSLIHCIFRYLQPSGGWLAPPFS